MTDARPVFVLYGYGSESTLRPLAEYLAARGHDTVVVDPIAPRPGDWPLDRLDQLTGRTICFLTSAHLERDARVLSTIYPEVRANSPLELLARLRPRRSFFYPHDLTTPIVLGEHLYLGLFDGVLAPTEGLRLYAHYCRSIEVVGWTKLDRALLELPRDGGWVWPLSDFVTLMATLGLDGLWRRCAPLVEQGVRIKLPDWPGAAEATARFERERPGCTIAPAANSIEVMWRARGVITNATSSCVVEAHELGRPVINIADPHQPPGQNRHAFAGLPRVRFVESPDEIDLGALEHLPDGPLRLLPFDFPRCETLLLRSLQAP